MRVMLNGLQAANRSGTGRYTIELLRALCETETEVIAVWPKGVDTPAAGSNLTVVSRGAGAARRVCFDQVGVRRLCRRFDPGVIHYPASVGPLRHVPKVVLTVHDLAFLHHPEWFRAGRAAYYRFAIARSARLATRVIADSQCTADDLCSLAGLSGDTVDVIPLGVGGYFRPASREAQLGLRQRLGLPERFFLYVGTLEPRKNLPRLVEAWSQTAGEHDIDLVIAGRGGWKTAKIETAMAQSTYVNRIHQPGYIPQADLPTLMGAAYAFLWPSLFEGFGLPPLEAMACGTPVLTSNTSSLPEVVGDAAITVDPCNVAAIAEGIRVLATDASRYDQLREAGLRRATDFSWARTAARTLATYDRVRS